jgi:hypothetical protein
MEAQMDEQERDHLVHEIRELQRSNRRWKFATFTLAAALAILPIMGLASSVPMVQMVRERNEAMMQLHAVEAARVEAERMAATERRAAERADDKPKRE